MFPLWAPTEADRLLSNVTDREGQLVPGSVSRYRIDADTTVDLLTMLVTLTGDQGERIRRRLWMA